MSNNVECAKFMFERLFGTKLYNYRIFAFTRLKYLLCMLPSAACFHQPMALATVVMDDTVLGGTVLDSTIKRLVGKKCFDGQLCG